ncbi:MAG TPA: diguanylate cyclase [Rhodopila sp.]|uniref:GGDEF domain-containing response regulator n=1 Tax=Rhodopila sp. TaxID=2480087 RepID=UPI002C917E49|nr:diguanylate cyclase [Rhodopila sp.]HVY13851.1 diguanylate cyclase [Rhodopila sp.]
MSATQFKTDQILSSQYLCMVLLVDDQPMIGEAIRRALSGQSDIDFHYCQDPSRAVDLADKLRPTVILQDLVMPGVDGLALVQQYRDQAGTREIPVIVLSTKEDPGIKSAAFTAGANDYLVKVPDKIELIARIRYHSRAYIHRLQRDAAYEALRESQQQLVLKNLELSRLINVDGLTGLNNRRYLDEFAEIEWKRSIREGTGISILMIDVDNFKHYNDTYGHLAGDDILRRVGQVMKRCAERPADIVARFGGEEFVAILPNSSPDAPQAFGRKLCAAVEGLAIPHANVEPAVVTVSVGAVFRTPKSDDSLKSAIDAADAALYKSKRAGRNRVIVSE